ncbi:MAG: 3D domain-containing protein [Blautia sp.]|nr:3D domain-containing protein [Blautia sp.]MDY3999664.1 3D domain-containing protein [Blautia sp.]
MEKICCAAVICAALFCHIPAVSAEVLDFEGVEAAYQEQGKTPRYYETGDGEGMAVNTVEYEDILYVTVRETVIRSVPNESGEELCTVLLGTKLTQAAVCSNGWSKVVYEEEGESTVIGYVQTGVLSDRNLMTKMEDTVTVAQDTDILDYPSIKDGEAIGEALEYDELSRTATVNGVWSRILYQDKDGREQIGYLPTSSLDGEDDQITVVASTDSGDEKETGTLHASEGDGVFTEAVDGVKEVSDEEATVAEVGVKIGSPVSVSSEASLVSLGYFRVTHYCPCSICCGPWTDGITSTGVTAVTNHTIAVDPTQIAYGTKVVINGQVYVAEDCGGAIKKNCIDVYVASHSEAMQKGVYYTEVYAIQ